MLTTGLSNVIIEMMNRNGLKVFDHEFNDINGGSSRYYICHQKANYKVKQKKINKLLLKETKIGLRFKKTYKIFFKKVLN